jgi:hypothetical protein
VNLVEADRHGRTAFALVLSRERGFMTIPLH